MIQLYLTTIYNELIRPDLAMGSDLDLARREGEKEEEEEKDGGVRKGERRR